MMSPDDKARIFINIEVGYSQISFLNSNGNVTK